MINLEFNLDQLRASLACSSCNLAKSIILGYGVVPEV